MSALRIQELVNHCIDHLADSPIDLLNCSLVARSWLTAAQSNLFRAPLSINKARFVTKRTVLRLYRSLKSSPHLLTHVRELDLDTVHVPRKVLEQLSSLPFTNLRVLCLCVSGREASPSDAVLRLTSLPSLRYLRIRESGDQALALSASIQILEHCSPYLEHLDFFSSGMSAVQIGEKHARKLMPIKLKSARLFVGEQAEHPDSLRSLYPLDLSQIKALANVAGPSVPWHPIPKATLEVLELFFWDALSSIPCDISAYPALQTLRLAVEDVSIPTVALLISSISSSQKIRTILLVMGSHSFLFGPGTELDGALCELSLRLQSLRMIAVEPASPECPSLAVVRRCLPGLVMTDKVCAISDCYIVFWTRYISDIWLARRIGMTRLSGR
ncbi:hypothetical protein R3P38DRAFT_1461635 [Favolaschia claudopus]|uniref:F-box domain-containing protein n=1 Tax=Favolaschia claudopus TaxID=2862362 RepID=A0AAW0DNS0_9AGAR